MAHEILTVQRMFIIVSGFICIALPASSTRSSAALHSGKMYALSSPKSDQENEIKL